MSEKGRKITTSFCSQNPLELFCAMKDDAPIECRLQALNLSARALTMIQESQAKEAL
jgi:hypothetical protein